MSRTSIKGQVFADLVTEFAETPLEDRVQKQNMDEKSVSAISYKNLCLGRYTLMVQRMIEDLE